MTEEAEAILIVDDEPDLSRLLQFNLKGAGFAPTVVGTATEALAAAEKSRPTVVLLDLMLPDLPGTEVCRRLRAHPTLHDVGILMLTARSDDYDRIVGFELGCDDYVVKPFNVREVILRVRALCRRVGERRAAGTSLSGAPAAPAGGLATSGTASSGAAPSAPSNGNLLRWRGLVVDTAKHRVTADDVELTLRPLEFKLLAMLLENVGTVLSRERLLEDVWGTEVNSRTVDTHVKRLRQRLGAHGECIETVVGFGYRVKDP